MLYGREDVSGHGFIRAAKLLKMNNSALPKASAQPGELFVSAVPRERRARAEPSDEKRAHRIIIFFAASLTARSANLKLGNSKLLSTGIYRDYSPSVQQAPYSCAYVLGLK